MLIFIVMCIAMNPFLWAILVWLGLVPFKGGQP